MGGDYLELSELDQIMPRVYLRWLLCFPLTSESPSKVQILEHIRSGVVATFRVLPLLQGHLVPKPSDQSRLRMRLPSPSQTDLELKTQYHDDVSDDTLPTYENLRNFNFRISDLPDKILTPPDLPFIPIFDIMPTFIRGGLLLCIKCHHVAVDGAGMGLITQTLARNCFAKADATADLKAHPLLSFDRSRLPIARSDSGGIDIGFELADEVAQVKPASKDYAPMTSHIFRFSAMALKKLKSLCETGTERITTHDALTALVYGTVCHARSIRLTNSSEAKPTLQSTFGIAVNGRSRIDPPLLDYVGNLTLYATFLNSISLPASEIPLSLMPDIENLTARLNLAKLSSQTHGAVEAVTSFTAAHISSVIDLSARAPNNALVQPKFADFFQGIDFFISSWAGFPVFDDEWWPGGFVEALRIPLNAQWDGTCSILPTRDRTAGLDLLIGMREDDMEVVREILFAFGAYIA